MVQEELGKLSVRVRLVSPEGGKIPGHPKEEGCSITWVAWGTRLGAFDSRKCRVWSRYSPGAARGAQEALGVSAYRKIGKFPGHPSRIGF